MLAGAAKLPAALCFSPVKARPLLAMAPESYACRLAERRGRGRRTASKASGTPGRRCSRGSRRRRQRWPRRRQQPLLLLRRRRRRRRGTLVSLPLPKEEGGRSESLPKPRFPT